jgi:YD repeat-containing protein
MGFLEAGYNTAFTYDALNRPVTHTQPDDSVFTYVYNKAGLPESILLAHKGDDQATYVENINYNEKGQRTDVYFGNESKTRYDYDPETFRLTRLLTTRHNGEDILQDLNYSYDPVGNITQVVDNAQQTHYFDNSVVEPTGTFQYDALYRLVHATGREFIEVTMPVLKIEEALYIEKELKSILTKIGVG